MLPPLSQAWPCPPTCQWPSPHPQPALPPYSFTMDLRLPPVPPPSTCPSTPWLHHGPVVAPFPSILGLSQPPLPLPPLAGPCLAKRRVFFVHGPFMVYFCMWMWWPHKLHHTKLMYTSDNLFFLFSCFVLFFDIKWLVYFSMFYFNFFGHPLVCLAFADRKSVV